MQEVGEARKHSLCHLTRPLSLRAFILLHRQSSSPNYKAIRLLAVKKYPYGNVLCGIVEGDSWKFRKSSIKVKSVKRSSSTLYHKVTPEHHRLIMYIDLIVPDNELFLEVTLKYMGSTLCLMAWAFPTRANTADTFSGSWRFSTTVLMAFITLQACCRSWQLRSISSGSSMSWNWLKYCLADGKLIKNLRRKFRIRKNKDRKCLFFCPMSNRILEWKDCDTTTIG